MLDNICGIYIIKNNINNKVYIGQSVNIKIRWIAHKYSAEHIDRQDSHTKIHTAMRELGVDNFYYEVIEECPINELNAKEIYWIDYYNAYKDGYNMTLGGGSNRYETNGRAILTLPQVEEIRMMYGARIPFREAYKRFEGIISKRGFQKVWRYETWLGILPEVYTDENREWHATYAKGVKGKDKGISNTKRACSEEEIRKMRELHSQGLNYPQISKIVNRTISTVRKYCLFQESPSPQATGNRQPGAIRVRNIETGLVFESLTAAAKWSGTKDGNRIGELVHGKINSSFTSGVVPSTGERAHWELA